MIRALHPEKPKLVVDRQRHGRRPARRGRARRRPATAFDIIDVRRRAVRQLQPHPAVERAQRLAGREGDLPQPARVVRGERRHPARRQAGHADRPRGEGRLRRTASTEPYDVPRLRHRLEAVRPADPGDDAARRVRLPHARRLPQHRRLREGLQDRGRHRRRAARAGSREGADDARRRGHGRRDGPVADERATRRGRREGAAADDREARHHGPDRRRARRRFSATRTSPA